MPIDDVPNFLPLFGIIFVFWVFKIIGVEPYLRHEFADAFPERFDAIFDFMSPRNFRFQQFNSKAGTLYPILHGLEGKGYLRSSEHRDGRRIRRVYKATAAGRKALAAAKVKVTELVGELFEDEPTPGRKKAKSRKR